MGRDKKTKFPSKKDKHDTKQLSTSTKCVIAIHRTYIHTYKTLFKHGKSSVLIIYKLYIKKYDNEAKHLLKLNTVLPDCRVGVTSIIIQIMF